MIDLSSDTSTRPTTAMRQAVVEAPVGDEQRGEDPTVTKLIERVCELLGKPAGLFLPSGTMANVIAVKVHTQPGETVLLGARSHILRSETGGMALVSGVMAEPIHGVRGCFGAAELQAATLEKSIYCPKPSLVCVEQTHNFGGGSIWPLEKLDEIREYAMHHGLAVHMDGARLMNAVVASGVAASTYAAQVDTVWIDFTKGLGAPLGAVLCGPTETIEKARLYKHMFGGALRQAGMMAAACLYALDHHVDRLADDHLRARSLVETLESLPDMKVEPADTNLIFFRSTRVDNATADQQLMERGVRISAVGDSLRMVTHLDISDEDVVKAQAALVEVFS